MENGTTTFKTGLRYGLILGVIGVIVSLIQYLTNMVTNTSTTAGMMNWLLNVLITGAVLYFAYQYYKNHNEGMMSLGEGVVIGLVAGLVGGLLIGIWSILLFHVIDPGLMDEIIQMTIDRASEEGEMPEEAEEMIGKMTGFMQSPAVLLLSSAFMKALSGLILGLILSLFVRNS